MKTPEVPGKMNRAPSHQAAVNYAQVFLRLVLGTLSKGLRLLVRVVGELGFLEDLDLIVRDSLEIDPWPLLRHNNLRARRGKLFGQNSACCARSR